MMTHTTLTHTTLTKTSRLPKCRHAETVSKDMVYCPVFDLNIELDKWPDRCNEWCSQYLGEGEGEGDEDDEE